MFNPRQASLKFLARLTAAGILAALPLTQPKAQEAPARQPSPNGKIVFQSTQGGDGFVNDIYVMDADGRRQTRLTDSPAADDRSPVWSPQGDKIAFISNRRGGDEIYLMNADGSNQRPLRAAATPGVPAAGAYMEWSPDGRRLKYETFGPELGNIYVVEVVNPDGSDSTAPPVLINVDRPAGSSDSEARWSPDGSRFVFRNDSCDFCAVKDLYVMNADGSNRVQLTGMPGFEDEPRWSPDGTRVVYEAFRDGARGIYVKSVTDGLTVETKVSGAVPTAGSAAWSPDGTRLAFISDRNNVYAVSPDGSGLALLTDVLANAGGVFWSPDGAKVAFHNVTSACVDIYVVNADGSRRATNYTKTRRDDEAASSWQRLATP